MKSAKERKKSTRRCLARESLEPTSQQQRNECVERAEIQCAYCWLSQQKITVGNRLSRCRTARFVESFRLTKRERTERQRKTIHSRAEVHGARREQGKRRTKSVCLMSSPFSCSGSTFTSVSFVQSFSSAGNKRFRLNVTVCMCVS